MRDELLGYLLNDLDDEQRSRIEERLRNDPIWQHELERLRSYVEEARQDQTDESDSPPVDLVSRTCSFVKKASAHGALSPAVLPASLSESQDTSAPHNKRWSFLDLTVVGGVLLALGALLLPALRESRDAARRSQCQEKLRSLGIALATYAEQTDGQLPTIDQHENAGMYAVKLAERGVLTREELSELLICPATKLAEDVQRGVVTIKVPTRIELSNAGAKQLQQLRQLMGGSYAYRVGYLDEQGNYRQFEFIGRGSSPLMADKPSGQVVGFQSNHHGGCGQNVLFQDLSVHYFSFCKQTDQDEHWFLNEKGKPAAGYHKDDVVMISSGRTPLGSLTKSKNDSSSD